MAHGSWLAALGSWLVARGSQLVAVSLHILVTQSTAVLNFMR